MRFSVFFELQISRPTAATEFKMFHDAVEEAVFAEALGYHGIWATEHHGLWEYAHSSAPEVFLSFVAARTKRIRIGHGVTLLPSRFNHPIRIAERIATLDILSEGRVNWGTGKGSTPTEHAAFETDVTTLQEQLQEALEIIPRMWRDHVFSHKGRFFDIPPTRIVPKPYQQPHPPVFVACSQPQAIENVGRLGYGALSFAVGDAKDLETKVAAYHRGFANPLPGERTPNKSFVCAPMALVLDNDFDACRYGLRGAQFFTDGSRRFNAKERPASLPPLSNAPLEDEIVKGWMQNRGTSLSSIFGDPVVARETVSRFAKIGVDEIIMIMQLGTVPHEIMMQSLKTFAEKVMPHFA